jgi:hypothetical protein
VTLLPIGARGHESRAASAQGSISIPRTARLQGLCPGKWLALRCTVRVRSGSADRDALCIGSTPNGRTTVTTIPHQHGLGTGPHPALTALTGHVVMPRAMAIVTPWPSWSVFRRTDCKTDAGSSSDCAVGPIPAPPAIPVPAIETVSGSGRCLAAGTQVGPMSKKRRLVEYSFRPALIVAMREAFQKACAPGRPRGPRRDGRCRAENSGTREGRRD